MRPEQPHSSSSAVSAWVSVCLNAQQQRLHGFHLADAHGSLCARFRASAVRRVSSLTPWVLTMYVEKAYCVLGRGGPIQPSEATFKWLRLELSLF